VSPYCVCHTGQCAHAQASQLTKRRAARCCFRCSISKISFSLFVMFRIAYGLLSTECHGHCHLTLESRAMSYLIGTSPYVRTGHRVVYFTPPRLFTFYLSLFLFSLVFSYNVDSTYSQYPHMQAFSESLIRNQSLTSTGNCPFIRVMRTAPGTRLTA
jgi:hypothetical protein